MKELIQKLVEITGPSGFESDVREFIKAELNGHVDDMKVDALGNLITRKGKKTAQGQTIMLSAHMDEIGIMVTHVDENGFVRFTTLGGVMGRNLAGGRVRFMNGAAGVFGMESGTRNSVGTLAKMYIDLGADSKKEVPVRVGDVGAFERTFEDMGKRIVSKALDDRVGVAILIEVMKQIKNGPNEIVGLFSTQEEVGVRGATTAAFGVDPDIGIAIDVTLTGDTPQAPTMEVALGKGPAIKVRDSGMLADPKIVSWMEAGAKRAKIPYQLEVLTGGSTDARAMQITREGIPAGCLSIACRYVHSPSEMVDYDDVLNSVKLLVVLLNKEVNL